MGQLVKKNIYGDNYLINVSERFIHCKNIYRIIFLQLAVCDSLLV